jgi:antitoxin component YwqK of YwqJK toxin-antitoxin module
LAKCKKGKLNGKAKEFDKLGNLTRIVEYDMGKEVNSIKF